LNFHRAQDKWESGSYDRDSLIEAWKLGGGLLAKAVKENDFGKNDGRQNQPQNSALILF